jgi:hypothetical protein
MYQCFGVWPGDQATLRHDVPIPKICSKASKAVEDPLEEAVGIPMKLRHSPDTLIPTYPIGIIDDGNNI